MGALTSYFHKKKPLSYIPYPLMLFLEGMALGIIHMASKHLETDDTAHRMLRRVLASAAASEDTYSYGLGKLLMLCLSIVSLRLFMYWSVSILNFFYTGLFLYWIVSVLDCFYT